MGVLSAIGELHVRPFQSLLSAADTLLRSESLLDDLGRIGDVARPVVIQGGLATDAYMYEPLADLLRSRGFQDVTATTLDFHGFGSFQKDAQNLSTLVAEASERSKLAGGDGLVTVLAHSKGGLTARWYLQKLGGVEHVDQLITLGTPHNGSAPYGTRLTALGGMFPGMTSLRQLSASSREVHLLNRDLPGFMNRARLQRPEFRMVSIAGDIDLPMLRETDGMVSNGSSRLDPSIEGLVNLVFKGHGAHHGAIAGQYGVHEATLRSATILASGGPLEQAMTGAAILSGGA
ncbi:MAG: hypothetical protein JWL76_151 [Thermoleophilia bacterium]|nr:hypothetical protein [Thermoleophilia bacterium]